MIRMIYMVEAYDRDGNLRARRYARNIKTARKIQSELYEFKYVIIRMLDGHESAGIDPDWVEG